MWWLMTPNVTHVLVTKLTHESERGHHETDDLLAEIDSAVPHDDGLAGSTKHLDDAVVGMAERTRDAFVCFELIRAERLHDVIFMYLGNR